MSVICSLPLLACSTRWSPTSFSAPSPWWRQSKGDGYDESCLNKHKVAPDQVVVVVFSSLLYHHGDSGRLGGKARLGSALLVMVVPSLDLEKGLWRGSGDK